MSDIEHWRNKFLFTLVFDELTNRKVARSIFCDTFCRLLQHLVVTSLATFQRQMLGEVIMSDDRKDSGGIDLRWSLSVFTIAEEYT